MIPLLSNMHDMYRSGMLYFQSELPERVAWRLGVKENRDSRSKNYNQESTTKLVISLNQRWKSSKAPTTGVGRKEGGVTDPYDAFLLDACGMLGCTVKQLKTGDLKILTQVCW